MVYTLSSVRFIVQTSNPFSITWGFTETELINNVDTYIFYFMVKKVKSLDIKYQSFMKVLLTVLNVACKTYIV